MRRAIRGSAAAGIALVTMVFFSACSTAGPAATTEDSSGSSAPSPSDTATATANATVDFGSAPDSSAPPCSALLPEDVVQQLVPGARAVDASVATADISGSWSFASDAGGRDCWSTNGVSPIDSVTPGTRDDPVYQGVVVTVLPGGAAALRRAQQAAVVPGMGPADVWCNASDAARVYCSAGVVAGEAWVDVQVTRLQDSTDAVPESMLPVFRSLTEQARQAVAASGAAAPVADVGEPDGSWTKCDASNVNAVASTTLRDAVRQTDTPPTVGSFAMHRIDGALCEFRTGERYPAIGATYSVAPDGAWIVERRLGAGTIVRHDRLDLPGLGEGDAAWRTCSETACSVDVVHDGGWTHYLLTAEAAPNTSQAVARWVEASFSA